jgi:hypothetical protein
LCIQLASSYDTCILLLMYPPPHMTHVFSFCASSWPPR